MTSFNQWIQTRIEMSAKDYCVTWLAPADIDLFDNEYRKENNEVNVKVHCYMYGFYIEQIDNEEKPFLLALDRSTYYFKTLEEAEDFAWEEFVRDELN